MDVFYCGFNGFKQVPSSADCDTLTCLTAVPHARKAEQERVVDVAICWNYLVIAGTQVRNMSSDCSFLNIRPAKPRGY